MADTKPTEKEKATAAQRIASTTGQDAQQSTIDDRAEAIEGQLSAEQIDTLAKRHTPETEYEVLHVGVDEFRQGQWATFANQDEAGVRRLLRLGAIGPAKKAQD